MHLHSAFTRSTVTAEGLDACVTQHRKCVYRDMYLWKLVTWTMTTMHNKRTCCVEGVEHLEVGTG